ncbi:PLP-dependent aminotransferase family protein [Acetobacteraceae bacterium H6797]|nr:PLP-dependent aminotransferase family protein [Acetobacteraceae bacterium H6797]
MPTPSPDWSDLLPLAIDRAAPQTIYRQLYLALRGLMLDGTLPAGSRLPPSRALAAKLGIARSSVVGVYEQLLAEGYVEGRTGAGTFVAPSLPEQPEPPQPGPAAEAPPPPPAVARYAPHLPDPGQFSPLPFNTGRTSIDERSFQIWRGLALAQWRVPDQHQLGYADPRGLPRLREAVARYLRAARAVHCEPEQILILNGVQQAIDLVAKVLVEPGDPVWVEDPAYPAMRSAMQTARARIVPVPVDEHGMVVQEGVKAAPVARLAYVTPSHQYPLGHVLSMARRTELLAWAREAHAWIIEDDYDSEFRYAGRPLASLQGIDRDNRVIYLGTLSKVLFPGLRLGYAVVPPELLPAMTAARYLTDRHPPAMAEAMVADFIEQGHFAGHLRRMRAHYKAARDGLLTALEARLGGALTIAPPDQGMHVLAYLGPSLLARGMTDQSLSAAARAKGVMLRPISPLFSAAPPRQGFMLGFTGHAPHALRAAVEKLVPLLHAA